MNEIEEIRSRIHTIRGKQVMLDFDLANLYGVETRTLNQAVRRNIERFPEDFMFQLTDEELKNWKSQIVISNSIKMGLRKNPLAFTEQGVAMLSGVLRSPIAVEVNIRIMRTFVAVRQYLVSQRQEHESLEDRIKKLELAFDESLRDRNDIDEDTRLRLEQIEETLAEMRADINHLSRNGNPGRMEVKGFKKEE